jgi:hypothetical protein
MVLPDILLLKNYPETRRFILDNSRILEVAYTGNAFEGVNLDSVCILALRQTDTPESVHEIKTLHEFMPNTDWKSEHAWRRVPQSLFRELRDHKFNIHLDEASVGLLKRFESHPRFGDLFEVHEGVHSGNMRGKLFIDTPEHPDCRELLFGSGAIVRYGTRWEGKWVRTDPSVIRRSKNEYANLGHSSYFEREKILIRRTGDYVMAALDTNHRYCSNNMFVLYPIDPSSQLDLRAVVSILNSAPITWYFRTIQPRVGRAFAELKINQIADFPIPSLARLAGFYPQLASLHDALSAITSQGASPKGETSRILVENQRSSLQRQIDDLVAELLEIPLAYRAMVIAATQDLR